MSDRGRGFQRQQSLRLPRSLLRVLLLNLQFYYEQLLRRLRRQEPRRTRGHRHFHFVSNSGKLKEKQRDTRTPKEKPGKQHTNKKRKKQPGQLTF